MTLDPLDSLWLASGGDFEPAETALCQALVSAADRCLDVGANIGYFTVLLSRLSAPEGIVTALEPDPANYALLETNCAPETHRGQILLHQAALGQAPGTARLFMSKDNTGMHRLYPSVCCTDAWHEVPVLVGDSFNLAPIDFIKIDIEGYEPAALAGLTDTIQRSPRLRIMAEFSPLSMLEAGFSPTDFIHRMADMGLQPWVHDARGWKPQALPSLLRQVSAAEAVDLQAMAGLVKQQDNAAVFAAASEALSQVGYQRPLLETLLWVSQSAALETQRRLAAASLAS